MKSAVRSESGTLALDLVQVARCVDVGAREVDFQSTSINGGYIGHFDLSDGPLPKSLTLQSCSIHRLSCTGESPNKLLITDSIVKHLYGVSRKELLPLYIDPSCDIEYYDPYATNDTLLGLEAMQLPLRVLLTILRKLYIQVSWTGPTDRVGTGGTDPLTEFILTMRSVRCGRGQRQSRASELRSSLPQKPPITAAVAHRAALTPLHGLLIPQAAKICSKSTHRSRSLGR
jgi:hypothetical protein